MIKKIGDESEMFGSPRVFPVIKPGPKWLGVTAAELGAGKIGWIRYDPEALALGDTRISLRVDLSDTSLALMRDDEVLREATVTIGREGTETPAGRYPITDTLTENLNPVYGAGAVVTSARQHSLCRGMVGRQHDRDPRLAGLGRRRGFGRLPADGERGRAGADRQRPARRPRFSSPPRGGPDACRRGGGLLLERLREAALELVDVGDDARSPTSPKKTPPS